jgi:hypothetical protein
MKILIFIEDNTYVRNYISTNAFSKLNSHDLKYFFSEKVSTNLQITNYEICDLKVSNSKLEKIIYKFVNQLQMYDKSILNSNFLFRLKRELIPNFQTLFTVPEPFTFSNFDPLYLRIKKVFPNSFFFRNIFLLLTGFYKSIKNIFFEIFGLARYFLIIIIVKLHLKDFLVRFFWTYVPLNASVSEILANENPDLIIVPNSIVGAEIYEILRVSNRLTKCKTLLLVDNWDNLSSKSVFISNPDYLGVWGKQSVEFAQAFHAMDKKNVKIVGTPRFEVYENFHKNKYIGKSHQIISQPYILFVGCALGFDELGALKELSEAISKISNDLPPDITILYRPHPWGGRSQYLSILKSNPIERVTVDPQILENENILGSKFQPSLDYYPHLLDKALFIVCPLSTMIIESTIMGKQVLALAHEDRYSLFSPNRILSNYKHFEGLDRLSNVKIIHDLHTLPSSLLSIYTNHTNHVDHSELEYFISANHQEDYAQRLAIFIEEINKDILKNENSALNI